MTWGKPTSRDQAEHILQGWIDSHAATFGNWSEDADLIYEAVLESGHLDIVKEAVRKMVQTSQNRWQHFYGREMNRIQGVEREKIRAEEDLEGFSQKLRIATLQSDPSDCPF